ncbi:MAG TPA: aldehyde dehydrogenase family protein [Vicinamibacteria bacterium]
MSVAAAKVEGLAAEHSRVGGQPVPGRAGSRPVVEPATGRPFAEVSLLDGTQAAAAVAAARAASAAWAALSFAERAAHLLALREAVLSDAEGIARLISREQGKPAVEAHLAEVFPALEQLRYVALHAERVLRDEPVRSEVVLFAHKRARLVHVPYGVVLLITPWNYPFLIPVVGIAAALAAGNTVVLKPAPSTTLVALRLAELAASAGLPPGVLNVVATDDQVAASLVTDPAVGKIAFTGSVETGKKIMAAAAANLTPVLLELGGKDAAIVCRDADLDRAARGIVWGAFMNAGQTCASVERVYVEQSVAEAFTARVVEETRRLRMGDPAGDEVEVGPLSLERQRRVVEAHVADALSRGARALTGGARAEGAGWFYPPTVLVGVDHSMRVMREESFGPVLPIMPVASVDEAIRLANDTEFGLTASGWTRDPATARRLQKELQAGVVTINDCVSSYGEPTAPWGGFKRSGIGRTHGAAGLREMAQVKYVSEDDSAAPALWWYPYSRDLLRLAEAANPAIHARSLMRKLRAQLQLIASRRFRGRVSLSSLLSRIDRLLL